VRAGGGGGGGGASRPAHAPARDAAGGDTLFTQVAAHAPPDQLVTVPQPVVLGLTLDALPLQSNRIVIESRWVSKPLAFAGLLRPRRLNN
jgi:hypothetical protein